MDFDCDRIQDLKDLEEREKEREDKEMEFLKEFSRSLSRWTWVLQDKRKGV